MYNILIYNVSLRFSMTPWDFYTVQVNGGCDMQSKYQVIVE